jgi:hypothetical protein
MVFTGRTDQLTCSLVGGSGPDDLFLATWDHDHDSWSVFDSSDADACADALAADQHDPGDFPLPDDAFKVDAQDATNYQEFTLSYLTKDAITGYPMFEATGSIRFAGTMTLIRVVEAARRSKGPAWRM